MNLECLTTLQDYFVGLQQEYCNTFSAIDGKTFLPDPWVRAKGGHGNSQVLSQGAVFEKAGVNFSRISDQSLPASATLKRPELAGCSFEAMGISLVLHPLNPHVPTAHANLRFFCAKKPDESYLWWFGGGFDLTPYYGYEEDCTHWHQTAKAACDPFGLDIYPKLKAWCDAYFYLNHRQEPRGIGGLFFDDLNEWPFETCFAFIRSLGNHFMQAYLPIVKRRMATNYSQAEKDFQLYRRGRYVEFNLVQDRGTLFGLQSGGRTESILMSMPPEVRWHYNWQALPASPEARLTEYFLTARDWLKDHQKILSLSS